MFTRILVYSLMIKSRIINACLKSNVLLMLTGFLDSLPYRSSREYLEIKKRESSNWLARKKNSVSQLWSSIVKFLRSQRTTSARPFLWRHPSLPGSWSPSRPVSEVPLGKTRALQFSCRQSILHKTIRLLRWQTLQHFDDQRRGEGTAIRLEVSQRSWETISARENSSSW